jgi:diguanylate cyclase
VLGLITSSAVIVHLSGGVVEAHFHFFVMVGVITLYQDWLPFGLALGYVVHHTVLGLVTPTDVFNHLAALRPLEVGADPRGLRARGQRRLHGHLAAQRTPGDRHQPAGQPAGRAGPDRPAPRRTGAEVCLAMVDLDDFKAYNDRFGHQAGDLVLKEAATAWRGEVRSTDLLARYGGEEFVLLLPACALDDAIRIVERLRVVTPWSRARSGWPAGISRRGAELIQRADQAPVHGQG